MEYCFQRISRCSLTLKRTPAGTGLTGISKLFQTETKQLKRNIFVLCFSFFTDMEEGISFFFFFVKVFWPYFLLFPLHSVIAAYCFIASRQMYWRYYNLSNMLILFSFLTGCVFQQTGKFNLNELRHRSCILKKNWLNFSTCFRRQQF